MANDCLCICLEHFQKKLNYALLFSIIVCHVTPTHRRTVPLSSVVRSTTGFDEMQYMIYFLRFSLILFRISYMYTIYFVHIHPYVALQLPLDPATKSLSKLHKHFCLSFYDAS